MQLKISMEMIDPSDEDIQNFNRLLSEIKGSTELKETIVPREDDSTKKKETKRKIKESKKQKEKAIGLSDVMKINLEVIDTFDEETSDDILKKCCELAGVKKINEIKDDEAKCEFCYYYLKLALKEVEVEDAFEEKDTDEIIDGVCKKLKIKDFAGLYDTTTCQEAIALLDKKLNE